MMIRSYKVIHGLSLIACLALTSSMVGCASVPPASSSPVLASINGLEKIALDHIRELSANKAPLAQTAFELLMQLQTQALTADQIVQNSEQLTFLQGLGLVTSENQITDVVQHALNAYNVQLEVTLTCWDKFLNGVTSFYRKEEPVVVAALKEMAPILLKLYAQDSNLTLAEQAVVDVLNYAVNNANTPNDSIPAVLTNVMDSKGNLHKDVSVIISALSGQIAQQASLQEDPGATMAPPATPVLRPVTNLLPPLSRKVVDPLAKK